MKISFKFTLIIQNLTISKFFKNLHAARLLEEAWASPELEQVNLLTVPPLGFFWAETDDNAGFIPQIRAVFMSWKLWLLS